MAVVTNEPENDFILPKENVPAEKLLTLTPRERSDLAWWREMKVRPSAHGPLCRLKPGQRAQQFTRSSSR